MIWEEQQVLLGDDGATLKLIKALAWREVGWGWGGDMVVVCVLGWVKEGRKRVLRVRGGWGFGRGGRFEAVGGVWQREKSEV